MKKVRVLVRCIIGTALIAILFLFLHSSRFAALIQSKKSINILAWPNVIDSEYFLAFERETGIQVNLSYFENYEELIVKMRSGAGDYDLIMASDYALKSLVDQQVVKPIDQSKLTFISDIYPTLINCAYDPNNTYSIPFSWEIYGLGIDTTYFEDERPTPQWKLLFDSPYRVGMLDDAREIISIAAFYLFGPEKNVLTRKDLEEIQSLLVRQKPRVVMYTDLRTDYLLISHSAPVVLGLSSDLYNAMRRYPHIDFLIPQEGSFILIDTFMIPATTEKDEMIYAFLNYLYQPDIMRKYVDRYNFFPVLQGVIQKDDQYLLEPSEPLLSRLRFFSYDIPEKSLRDIWITLKS